MAGLCEGLVAHMALVGPHTLMCEQMCMQVAQLFKQLPTQVATMWLYAVVAQDVRDQIVFGGVRLLAHAALPSLFVLADVYTVAVIYMNTKAKFLSTITWLFTLGPMTRIGILSRVESTS